VKYISEPNKITVADGKNILAIWTKDGLEIQGDLPPATFKRIRAFFQRSVDPNVRIRRAK